MLEKTPPQLTARTVTIMVVGLVVIAALIYFLAREQATEPEPAPEQSQAAPESDPATDPEQPPRPQPGAEPAAETAPAAVEETEVEVQPPTPAEPAKIADQPQPETMAADPAAAGEDDTEPTESAPAKPKPEQVLADTASEPEQAPADTAPEPEQAPTDPAADTEQPPQPQPETVPAPQATDATETPEDATQPSASEAQPAEPAATADQPQPETMAADPAAAGEDDTEPTESAPAKPKPEQVLADTASEPEQAPADTAPEPEQAPTDPAADTEQPPQPQPETVPAPQATDATETPEDATQPSASEAQPAEPAATADQPQPETMTADRPQPARTTRSQRSRHRPNPNRSRSNTASEPEQAPTDPAADTEQPPQPQPEGEPAPEPAPSAVEATEESAQPPTSEGPSAESAVTARQAGQASSETPAPAADETGAARGQPEEGRASMPSDQQAGMADEPEGAIVSDPVTSGDQPLTMAAGDDRSDEAAATANAPEAMAETAASGEAGAGVAGMVGQEPVAEAAVQPGDGDAVTNDIVSLAPGSGQQALDGQVTAMPPTFDVVRVDRFGTTTIAGRAPARSLVQAIVNDEVASSQRVGAHGQFAMIFSVDTALDTLEIRLRAAFDDGTDTMSEDTVFVMVPRPDTGIADAATAVESGVAGLDIPTQLGAMDQPGQDQLQPSVFLATSEGARMIQSPIAASGSQLLVDMISYDEKGEVIISGNASSGGSHVLIYLNNELVKSRKIAGDGTWWTGLSEVKPGRYTLRIDEIDENGGAVARVEMPFQKEPAELAQRLLQLAARSAEESDARISEPPAIRLLAVQRGFTLWGISREHYGLGRLYVNIFTANKDQIRDPDLIYPGQIFVIPDESTLIDPLW